ncbi:hypothetical protein AB0M45_29380 [Nocardia sp. NPDC051787]|uniref:hypothetical protein n=1 Tax=Nocardia sp. NPDC051787 TaxID=3155415 RepID=UPI0034392C60
MSFATAAVIARQLQRAGARFPDEPAAELKLLPTLPKNPHGRKAITETTLGARHRDWVTALPEIHIPVTVDTGTATQVAMIPYDNSRILLYAYRHTYAQRHADAGVPADVLRELMDHLHIATSLGHYRVGETRRRAAVDRGHDHAVRPARQPPVASRASPARRRAPAPRSRHGRGPLRHLQRAQQRRRRRKGPIDSHARLAEVGH